VEWLLLAPLAAAALFGPVGDVAVAGSSTFVVSSTADTGDSSPDGACESCTLREAMEEANGHPGADTIEFNVAGAGPHTIAPGSQLPTIEDTLTIDGYSQPGAQENTVGNATAGTNAVLQVVLSERGLRFTGGAAGSVVKGLVIGGADGALFDAALAVEADGIKIEGCFLGTDAAGTAAAGNSIGILVDANNLRVGGTKPRQRNLISGNVSGIHAINSSANVIVEGNLIGTDASAIVGLANGDGVRFENSAANARIGGKTAAAANIIAFSTNTAIVVSAGNNTGIRIQRNSIFMNGDLGIDLGEDGVTPNDDDDPDDGPNRLQNTPLLTLADSTVGEGTKIKGTFNSTPNKEFLVEFYSTPAAEGNDEGKVFLGKLKVTTDRRGDASFTLKIGQALNVGDNVTATATNLKKRDTSEFSPAVLVS
jgi:CSLREA domain-containing protein